MTKYEKISLFISIVALICSTTLPIVTYEIFQPIKEDIKYAGKLQIQESFLFHDNKRTGYRIDMVNIGFKPLKDITIGMLVRDKNIGLPMNKSEIELVPVAPFSYELEGNRAYIKINKVLAAEQKLTVFISGLKFPETADSFDFFVFISSDMGDAVDVTLFRGDGMTK
jgi:hypothetical protein